MHGIARDLQRAAERGEKDAECEHAGEQPFLIDTECGHHVAVLRRRAHQNAPAGALEQQPENAEHDRAERDQEQIIARDVLAEEIDRAPETRRATAEQIARAPDHDHEILDHQREAERRKQLEQFGCVVNPPQQRHFDQHADCRDDQRRGDNAAPEAERAGKIFGQREGDIGAEHIKGAVGKIDDPRHAKDDRQARSDQEQRRGAGKSGQELYEVKGHLAVRVGVRLCLSPVSAGRGRRKGFNPSAGAFRLRRRSGDSQRPCDRPTPPSPPCRPSARSCRRRRQASTGGRSCGR